MLPAGPDTPAAEQTLQWFAHPYAFMKSCAARFGDVFTVQLRGTGAHVFFSHPEAIRQIFAITDGRLDAGEGNAVWLGFMGRHSMLILDGEAHQRERRVLGPAFGPAPIRHYVDTIREVAARVADGWPLDRPVSLLSSMLDISLEVILRAVFGLEEAPRHQAIRAAVRRLLEAAAFGIPATMDAAEDLGAFHPWRRFQQQARELDGLLYAEIGYRRARPDPERRDVMSHMIAGGMSDEALRDELVTLLMAGHETTATTLAWAFYWTLRAPGAADRIRSGDAAWLDAVCRETLRIHPTVPMVSRRVKAAVEIAGHAIPAGVNVSPCVYLVHHRTDLYPEPEAFRPERFMERRFAPFEYLPFGGGHRRCLGAEFALQEIRAVLDTVLDRLDLELAEPEAVRPVRRNVTIAPAGGTRVVVTRRRESSREGGRQNAVRVPQPKDGESHRNEGGNPHDLTCPWHADVHPRAV